MVLDRRITRVQWIDVMKYVCIMCVMLCHLEFKTEILNVFYSPFFLNGFFFAAGYVFVLKDNFKVFLIKKIKGLFFPWFFFSLIHIVLPRIFSLDEHASFFEELKWNFLQIREHGDGMWFVAALFVAFIPFYLIIKWHERMPESKIRKIGLLSAIIILAFASELYAKYMNPNILPWGGFRLPWHLEYIFIAVLWMYLGYLFKNEIEKIFEKNTNSIKEILTLIVYLMIRFVPYFLQISIKNKVIMILYSFACDILGVLLLIVICKKIQPNKYILYVGQNTIIYFALHTIVIRIVQIMLFMFINDQYQIWLNNKILSFFIAVIYVIVLSLVLIVPTYVINRWFPFLIGRKYRKKFK